MLLIFTAKFQAKALSLNECLENIKSWKTNHFFQLNENKTDVILFGPHKSTNRIINNIRPLSQCVSPHVRNLGGIFYC